MFNVHRCKNPKCTQNTVPIEDWGMRPAAGTLATRIHRLLGSKAVTVLCPSCNHYTVVERRRGRRPLDD